MNFAALKQAYSPLAYALLATLVIWLAGVSGLSGVVNGLFYDRLITFTAADGGRERSLLLIESNTQTSHLNDAAWEKLLDELARLQARQVVFGFMPNTSRAFYERAAGMGNVMFGRRLVPTSLSPDDLVLEPLREAARGLPLRFGIMRLTAGEQGVQRRQTVGLDVGGEWHPSLETVAASQWHGRNLAEPAAGAYLINYAGGRAGPPQITLDRVLAGELIPELVTGKSVLIGLADPERNRLYTPLSGRGPSLSPLQVHGQALETLLKGRVIREVHSALLLLVLLAVTGASFALFQLLSVRFSVAVTLLLLGVYGLLAWLALGQFRLWLPLFDLWAQQLVVLFIYTRTLTMSDERKARRLLFEASAHMRERLFPPSFYASQEHWSQVAAMVNQTLNLQRLIFLERVESDHRVREVKALNCALTDISEKRRDYERTPYSTAISENRAVVVKDYLSRAEDEEVQYLVPLTFGGDVMGFWAFGILPRHSAALPKFDAVIDSFADQIAELLFQRQAWLASHAENPTQLSQYLRLEMGQQSLAELGKTFALMERRLNSLEGHLNGLTTATILYDLFGRVVIANRPMTELLREAKLAPYDMTALDLLCALTALDQTQARRMLQSMVFDRRSLAVQAQLAKKAGGVFLLRLSPVSPQAGGRDIEGEARPFRLEGILCEIIDVTAIASLCGIKDKMLERVNFQVRNDLESLLTAVTMLATTSLDADRKARVLEISRSKVDSLVSVLSEMETHLSIGDTSRAVQCYPIDGLQPLTDAVANIRDKAAQQMTALDIDLPDFVSLVLASPEALQQLFSTILAWLLEDSVETGSITVRLEERERRLVYDFSNVGFGMDERRLQSILFGTESQDSVVLTRLRDGAKLVADWGGTLEAHSELGVGTRFRVDLKGFI